MEFIKSENKYKFDLESDNKSNIDFSVEAKDCNFLFVYQKYYAGSLQNKDWYFIPVKADLLRVNFKVNHGHLDTPTKTTVQYGGFDSIDCTNLQFIQPKGNEAILKSIEYMEKVFRKTQEEQDIIRSGESYMPIYVIFNNKIERVIISNTKHGNLCPINPYPPVVQLNYTFGEPLRGIRLTRGEIRVISDIIDNARVELNLTVLQLKLQDIKSHMSRFRSIICGENIETCVINLPNKKMSDSEKSIVKSIVPSFFKLKNLLIRSNNYIFIELRNMDPETLKDVLSLVKKGKPFNSIPTQIKNHVEYL